MSCRSDREARAKEERETRVERQARKSMVGLFLDTGLNITAVKEICCLMAR